MFNLITCGREHYLRFLETYPLDKLLLIPAPLSNNIIWNAAHIVATLDVLTYTMCQLKSPLSPDFVNKYKKGTQPELNEDESFVNELKHLLKEQVIWTQKDYENKVFPTNLSKEYTTSYGNTLVTIEDSLRFDSIHEGLHLGTILAIRKFL